MPNPQQPELARARRSDAVSDDALPAKAQKRSRTKKGAVDAPGPIPEDNLPGHQPEAVPDKPLVPPEPYRLRAVEDEVRGPIAEEGAGPERVRFPFVFDRLLTPFSYAVGVTPMTSWVVLDDDELFVRFGPWSLRTPRSNIVGCEVTGPYLPWKVAGPPHLSLRDLGVTFATNRRQGACIRFREPVAGLLPRGVLRHPAATVTVSNPADLARRLGEAG